MKIWVDDVRPAPEGYVWLKSTNEAKNFIRHYVIFANHTLVVMREPQTFPKIELIDIDYDAGDFQQDGGDYIKILDWLEYLHLSFPIRIHSANPVGVANMRRIIQRNGWKEMF